MTELTESPVPSNSSISQIVFEGGTEVIGPREAAELIEQASRRAGCGQGEPAMISSLQRELEERFGTRGGQGVALRLGRASFKYGFRQWGEASGLTAQAFRLKPAVQRIPAALERMGGLLGEQCGSHIEVSEDESCWYWRVESCPACHERQAANNDCHLVVGFLQETLAWASGGRYFQVTETECSAAGAPACIFRIDKKPLD